MKNLRAEPLRPRGGVGAFPSRAVPSGPHLSRRAAFRRSAPSSSIPPPAGSCLFLGRMGRLGVPGCRDGPAPSDVAAHTWCNFLGAPRWGRGFPCGSAHLPRAGAQPRAPPSPGRVWLWFLYCKRVQHNPTTTLPARQGAGRNMQKLSESYAVNCKCDFYYYYIIIIYSGGYFQLQESSQLPFRTSR